MSSVCFTGRGNLNGTFTTRDVWENMASDAGFIVHDKVYPHTEYLVASRSDTTKAASAKRNGTTVLSYDQFAQLLNTGIAQVGKHAKAAQAPDLAALKAAIDEASQTIEGWGSF